MLRNFHRFYSANHCKRVLMGIVLLGLSASIHADSFDQATATAERSNRADAKSQDRIDNISAETQALLERHRAANWKSQRLELYIDQLDGQIRSQKRKMTQLKEQIVEVEVTKREIVPLMTDMIDTLEQFITLDLPFERAKRLAQVEKLRANMIDAEVSVSERFRHILDAYKRESKSSRELATGREELQIGDRSGVFELLRIGRIGLYSLSLDGDVAGVWDASKNAWLPLASELKSEVVKGLKIAKDRSAPALLELPVQAPVAVEIH